MRTLGYIVGFLLLANGVMTTALPRWWTDVSARTAERVLPETRFAKEAAGLSSGTLRYLGFWESVMGLLFLAMAGRIREAR